VTSTPAPGYRRRFSFVVRIRRDELQIHRTRIAADSAPV